MRLLTSKDHRSMPWSNGGGTTTEIVREPASGERFLYRVSIADVATDGPFSRFEGYDRHILLLEGAGMTLDCGAHGRIELARDFEPRSFSGDWEVRGTLVAGVVRDFNLIVDRDQARSSLEVRTIDAPVDLAADGVSIVHVLAGALEEAELGDTLVVDGGESSRIAPRGRAQVVIARVVVLSGRAPSPSRTPPLRR